MVHATIFFSNSRLSKIFLINFSALNYLPIKLVLYENKKNNLLGTQMIHINNIVLEIKLEYPHLIERKFIYLRWKRTRKYPKVIFFQSISIKFTDFILLEQ